MGFTSEDLPFEPPKNQLTRHQFDKGPINLIEEIMEFYLSVKNSPYSDEIIQAESFGPTGIYRGNTENPEFLIIADQQSHTDMFSGRALTGASGQKLQAFLNGAGLQNKYLIIRSLPVDCLDDQTKELKCEGLRADPIVNSKRNALLEKIIGDNNIKSILSFGKYAKQISKQLNENIPIYHIDPTNTEISNELFGLFEKLKNNKLISPNHKYRAVKIAAIPRSDLPYSSRWWMGTSGDRVSRSIEMKM